MSSHLDDDSLPIFFPDDPHTPAPISTGHLAEWALLIDGLAVWLANSPEFVHHDYQRCVRTAPFAPASVPALIQVLTDIRDHLVAALHGQPDQEIR
jgi:hypothetical protein